MPVEISVIIPVFNEADNVLPVAREVAAAMNQCGREWELLFVDDASADETPERIQQAAESDQRIRGLRHQRNAGQSAALWTGIQATSGSIICTLDGDRQNDPADLPAMIAELGRVDFVTGMRVRRQDNWLRKISSMTARWARKAVLGIDFRDSGCALRAFKRSSLEGVFPFNGLHRFLPIIVHGGGARTIEIPVSHRERVAGCSKYGVWNRLGRGIYDLIAMAWYQKRRSRPVATIALGYPAAADEPSRRTETGRRRLAIEPPPAEKT